MRLPTVSDPPRYRGLYVFDFGEWSAVGYTAEEIAVLLESPEYRNGKVYKIQRASSDGRMELMGVASERFQLESGIFFYCGDERAARVIFDQLSAQAEAVPPPTRSQLHLARRSPELERGRFVVALIYPAEFEEEVSGWLVDAGQFGGDWAEGGISHVSDYYAEQAEIVARKQLWSAATPSRSSAQVLSSVRRAVQR